MIHLSQPVSGSGGPPLSQTLGEAMTRVGHLLLTLVYINAAFATLIALGLYAIGVPYALLWGVLAGILRFELAYQARRPWPWLMFGILLVVCFLMTRDAAVADALYDDFFANSPFSIAVTTVRLAIAALAAP